MVVKRIVADIGADRVAGMREFYRTLFDMEVVMDLGWIVTLASAETAPAQISIASEGGSGMPEPDLSIEVDNVDDVHARARRLDCSIVYDLTDEPWGVRRFFLRDPAGKLLNVLSHRG